MSFGLKGCLVLETGECFEGAFLGGQEQAGELVFNTSHSGYEEIATDPSYFNQILIMTAPMQGNYGADDSVWESNRIHIQGFVCLEMQEDSSQWKNKLLAHGVPILAGANTRALALVLRTKGALWGALVQTKNENTAREKARHLIMARQKMEKDWAFILAEKQQKIVKGEKTNGPRMALMDFGCKKNILRELVKRSQTVGIFPPRTPAEEILKWNPSALVLSNGPGDPAKVQHSAETVKLLLGKMFIFGICMGHQILARALGGETYKLKFGHRGCNHPVRDKILNKIYVTSQNHGYAVRAKSLPEEAKITHINLNDGTLEGFFSKKSRCLGIQFHPESHPGPHEAESLFDFFAGQISL